MKTIITFLFTLLNYLLYSQNLVLNSSFEEFTKCPIDYNGMKFVNNWELSDKFSANYLNICDTTIKPCKYFGGVKPRTGNGCAAFEIFSSIVGKLSIELKKDSLYEITAYVHLAPKSNAYLENIEIYLESYTDGNIRNYIRKDSKHESEWYRPMIIISCDSCNKKEWKKISAIYKAKGGESLLCIGSIQFIIDAGYCSGQKNLSKNIKSNSNDFKPAYYYIDDVSLTKYYPIIEANKPIAVYDIHFKTNSSELQAESIPYLNELVKYFTAENKLKIEIMGHTDNTGTAAINNSLSLARAESVKNYFISKGIATGRITTFGLGSTKPIGSNATDEGRAKNRRIEFKIIK